MEELDRLHWMNYDLDLKMTVLHKAIGNVESWVEGTCTVNILEPKPFHGSQSAKDLENFIWDIEWYFSTTYVTDVEKLTMASMYLARDMKLWWRTQSKEDENVGKAKIEMWESLKKELKE